MDKHISQLQEMIEGSNYTVAITGAGISTPTGIKDMEHMNFVQAIQTTSAAIVRARPDHCYKLLQKSFLKPMFETGPSVTHKKLAELEERSLLQGVITTNIDCLHSLAGSRNVAELQGSYGVNKCLKCGRQYNDVQIWNQGKAPRCEECNGVIVAFPVYTHVGLSNEDYQKASRWISQAELVLVIGSKGMYGGYFNSINPRARVAQVNPSGTSFDRMATLNIRRKADEVFGLLN